MRPKPAATLGSGPRGWARPHPTAERSVHWVGTAEKLEQAGITIEGTSPASADFSVRAEKIFAFFKRWQHKML